MQSTQQRVDAVQLVSKINYFFCDAVLTAAIQLNRKFTVIAKDSGGGRGLFQGLITAFTQNYLRKTKIRTRYLPNNVIATLICSV